MWITWTSVLWMAFCLAALIGVGVAISPYLPLTVVVVPMVLAGLNSSRGICANWCHFAFAAVPFVLVTTVNSVQVFLYALATLDRSVSLSVSGVLFSHMFPFDKPFRLIYSFISPLIFFVSPSSPVPLAIGSPLFVMWVPC